MKILIFVLLSLLLHPTIGPAAQAEQSQGSEINMPWDAFKKLIKLDQDEVVLTWDEFQKLIKQTGIQETPHFQMKNGNVVLSRSEFKRLLNRMKSPPSQAPKYFLTKAVYKGRIGKKGTRIKAQINLQVLAKEKDIQPLRIPLFPGQMAFEEILIDGKQALIENDGSRVYLTVTEPGDHILTAVFSLASSLEKEPHQLYFNIPRTPITQLKLILPIRNVDVKVTNATQIQTRRVEGGTEVVASLPVQDSINMTWNPVTPVKAKGPAKMYGEVYNMISIEEDALRVQTRVDLDVLQNTINVINLGVPEGYSILNVQGEGVGDWKWEEENQKVLIVPFRFARKGKFYVTITSEKLLTDKNVLASFDGFKILKTVREKGFVGVELKTSAEAKALDLQGLDRVDVRELPRKLLTMASRPLIFGFRYLRQPYEFNLDIQRHEEVAVISTVIDEANGVTLIMKDGKRVDHLTFKVRNSWKQFLELSLPKKAQVWSAFVEGQRVKPSRNADGKVLIPLNRSKSSGQNLQSFDVEVMYYIGTHNLKPLGQEALSFPIPDVVVSQLLWSVYLPTTFDYLYFGGNVDKEKRASGLKPLASTIGGGQQILKDLSSAITNEELYYANQQLTKQVKERRVSSAKNSVMWSQRGQFDDDKNVGEDTYARQVERELNFFNQLKQEAVQQGGVPGDPGVLPIRVNLPRSGKVFRFSKQILVDQKPVDLTVVYINKWLTKLLKVTLLIIFIVLLYRSRKRFVNFISWIQRSFSKYERQLRWGLSPTGFVVVSFVLLVLSSFISKLLVVVSFLSLIGAVGRWGWATLKAKRSPS